MGASFAPHFSEIVDMDVQVHAGETVEYDLNPKFEHAVLALSSYCWLENQHIRAAALSSEIPARACIPRPSAVLTTNFMVVPIPLGPM